MSPSRSAPSVTLVMLALSALVALPTDAQQARRTASLPDRGLSAADFPAVRQIATDVYVWSDLHPSGAITSNSLIVVGDEGVLVADGQGSPEATRAMVEGIGRITDRPIRWVIVGSDHGDHTGGNAAFPGSATFYAHPTSIANLERGDGVVPTEAVSGRRVLRVGGTEVHVAFEGRGHTAGDLQVYLPDPRVLFMSEAYLYRVFPAMRSAYPSEWVDVLRRAEARTDVDVWVPGHGFIDPPEVLREELTVYREAVEAVIAEATRLHGLGLSREEALGRADWGALASWTLAESQGPVALRRVWDELDGNLTR